MKQNLRSMINSDNTSNLASTNVSMLPSELSHSELDLVSMSSAEGPVELTRCKTMMPVLFTQDELDPIPKNAVPARYILEPKVPDSPPPEMRSSMTSRTEHSNTEESEQQPEVSEKIVLSPIHRKRDNYVQERNSEMMQSKTNLPTPVKKFTD
jgi:hypothetical protein